MRPCCQPLRLWVRFAGLSLLALWIGPSLAQSAQPSPAKAVYDLIGRVIPVHAHDFTVALIPKSNGKDVFELESAGGKIILRGSTGVAAASALNYYLKTYAHCDIGWNGTQLNLPDILPAVPEKVRKETPYTYRYYLNYCTFNYTASWWDWKRWQWEIDWMALNGVNMPLALTGQNVIWKSVYKSLGFTDKELEGFFSGPAYFNWFWMGNLDGWGGPLPDTWMKSHEALQKQILARERSLGMTPVLPAFTGHVPPAFKERFPQAHLRKTNWGTGFSDVYILDPNDPQFSEIGRRFLAEEVKTYGTDHLYSADTFNENEPPENDSLFLNNVSSKVYRAMASVDPKATWVMQGWLFVNDGAFWKPTQIKALLNAVPNDKMIILDLWSETNPVWNRTDAYYGKPWIWCMLHNFGGNIGLFGRMPTVATAPATALHDPASGRLSGIGLTPEAIEQNPALYQLMLDNTWRKDPIDLDAWVRDYARRRYGKENALADSAWAILTRTVYNGNKLGGAPESILTGRPTWAGSTNWTSTGGASYAPRDLWPAWTALVAAAPELGRSDGFQYDLVDVTRQVLADYADSLQQSCAEAYREKDVYLFRYRSARFLELLDDMDKLLGTRRDFLLGPWLSAARAWGTTGAESDLFEKNARDLITLWGDKNSPLHEYACKQWSGLISAFYKPRWAAFFAEAADSLEQHKTMDVKAFDQRIRDWEWDWVNRHDVFPDKPTGDPVATAVALYHKYMDAWASEGPTKIPLWTNGAPGFERLRDEAEQSKDYWVKNIHNPSITVYAPPGDKANGTAVLVCPGGGHRLLVYNAEGRDPALFLNSLGVTVFVLKYRLFREDSIYSFQKDVRADVYRAMRYIRTHASDWGIDTARVGILGFSAGGETAALVAYGPGAGDPSAPDPIDRANAQPNFQMLVYPGPLGIPDAVPSNAPPTFLVAADDDTCCSPSIIRLMAAYRAAGVPVEAHLYAHGSHGFNMGYRSDAFSIQGWPARMADWLHDNRWLEGQPIPYGPLPTPRQVAWEDREFYLFVHFGPNTFTDLEWGKGTEKEAVFNPTALDCRQWCRIAEAAGAKGIIITAKHHDGFCLWPSKYSTHTVAQSPWKNGNGDVLGELAAACKEYGLKMGVYLSPWDRNHPKYGTAEYNQVYIDMMKEVVSRYGPFFEFWWDGANGEGPNGKKQLYTFGDFEQTMRAIAPNTAIFSDIGPDARWVGNESGIAGTTNWDLLDTAGFTRGAGAPPVDTLNQGNFRGAIWLPAECDVSIRPGWFYHSKEDTAVKSPERLFHLYLTSVGRGANMNLNVPADREGRFTAYDSAALVGFRKLREESFSKPLLLQPGVKISLGGTNRGVSALTDGDASSFVSLGDDYKDNDIAVEFPAPTAVDCIVLQEPIRMGQRVIRFSVRITNADGSVYNTGGTTIGHKRILTFPKQVARSIRIYIDEAKATPLIGELNAFMISERLIER